MNYTETLAYLDSLGKFGINLGMERIEDLLKELNNPEQKSGQFMSPVLMAKAQ